MTPSDDEIRAARIALDLPDAGELFDSEVRALYRAAYAAGMEAAAQICDAQMEYFIDRTVYIGVAGAGKCVDAIRAAKESA